MIIFDIETKPKPIDELLVMEPLEASALFRQWDKKNPGVFQVEKVKLGNIKDQLKKQAKIDEAKAKHDQECELHEHDGKELEQAHCKSIIERSTLDPLCSEVAAIGYISDTMRYMDGLDDQLETDLIGRFWDLVAAQLQEGRKLVGWNIFRFDLPYLARRSVLNGITIPKAAIVNFKNWSSIFIDLMQVWGFGLYNDFQSLDRVARAFRRAGKMKHDKLYWEMSREDKEVYLRTDLEETLFIANELIK